MKALSVSNSETVSKMLAMTEPGCARHPQLNKDLIAAVDAIARKAASTSEERGLLERVAQRGQICADERALFGDLLRRGAETADERELVRRAAGVRTYLPAATPEPPENTDLARRIGEAAAKNAADHMVLQKAVDELLEVQIAARRRPPKDEDARQRQAEALITAEDAVRLAQGQWDTSRAHLANLVSAREADRRFWRVRQTTQARR
jgi:hypothetical protein